MYLQETVLLLPKYIERSQEELLFYGKFSPNAEILFCVLFKNMCIVNLNKAD